MPKRQRGWSLMEALVGMAVASAMTSVAVPNMVSFKEKVSVSTAANEMISSLHLARSEALRRAARVAVSPVVGNDWRTGWIVYADANDNGHFDAGVDEAIRTSAALPAGVRVEPRFGIASDGSALSYTAQGTIRRPGSQGLVLGRLTVSAGPAVRSLCVAVARVRTVDGQTCA